MFDLLVLKRRARKSVKRLLQSYSAHSPRTELIAVDIDGGAYVGKRSALLASHEVWKPDVCALQSQDVRLVE